MRRGRGKLDCLSVSLVSVWLTSVLQCSSLISIVNYPPIFFIKTYFFSSAGAESSRSGCQASLQKGQLKGRKMSFGEKHAFIHEVKYSSELGTEAQ